MTQMMANGPYASQSGMLTPRPVNSPKLPDVLFRKTASHESALHHEGIMYGMMISMPSSFLPGMSVRTISQAISAPNGTEMTVTNKPIVSECSSGSQRIASVKGLASSISSKTG